MLATRFALFVGGTSLLCASFAVAATSNTYFIGNSLTANLVADPTWGAHTGRLQYMAGGYGDTLNAGYHIVGGSGLTDIANAWNNSGHSDGAWPAPYATALAGGTYDQIVVEPWRHSVNSEIAAMSSILGKAPAGSHAPVFIYETWPAKTLPNGSFDVNGTLDYLAVWNAPYTDNNTAVAYNHSAAYFDAMLTKARQTFTDRPVYMIPLGEVMAEIQRRIKGGTFTGLNDVTDLYGDGVHQAFYGEYLDCLVMDAVLFKHDITDMPRLVTDAPYISASLDAQFKDVISDVVFGNAAVTGVPEPTTILSALAVAPLMRRRRR